MRVVCVGVLLLALASVALAVDLCVTWQWGVLNVRQSACGEILYQANPGDRFTFLDSRVSLSSQQCSAGSYTWLKLRNRNGAEVWAVQNALAACPGGDGGGDGGSGPGTGDRWISRAGSYTVERLDRSGRRSAVRLTQPADKFVLHTIEGRWPQTGDWEVGTQVLDGSTYWPHFIVARDYSGRVRIGQYLPLDVGGYALETGNADGAIQVEIGAKAERPFTSNDAEITAAVRALFQAVRAATGMPNQVDSRVRFTQSGAWGYNAPQRLSAATYRSVKGLVGHQHVYGNSHWDPGAINPNALL